MLRLLAAWVFAGAPGVVAAEDARAAEPLALVVHAGWRGPDAVSLATLRQLYLGRRTRLGDQPVRCLDLPAGSAARSAFTGTVIGRSERSLDRYWLRQALAGGPPPPRELDSPAAVLAHVGREPGALGYVAFGALSGGVPAGVRILAIRLGDRDLGPADAAYPLRIAETLPAPTS